MVGSLLSLPGLEQGQRHAHRLKYISWHSGPPYVFLTCVPHAAYKVLSSMHDTIRDAPFGQVVRFLSNGRIFPAPEEKQSFALPAKYALISFPTPIQPGDNDDKCNSEIPSEPDGRRQSTIPSEFEEKRKSNIPSEAPSDHLSGIRWDGDQQEEYSAADVERNFQPLAVQPSNDSTTIVTWVGAVAADSRLANVLTYCCCSIPTLIQTTLIIGVIQRRYGSVLLSFSTPLLSISARRFTVPPFQP